MYEGDKYITNLIFVPVDTGSTLGDLDQNTMLMNYTKDYSLFNADRVELKYRKAKLQLERNNYDYSGRNYWDTAYGIGYIGDFWKPLSGSKTYPKNYNPEDDVITDPYDPSRDNAPTVTSSNISNQFYIINKISFRLPLSTFPNAPRTIEEAQTWKYPSNLLSAIGGIQEVNDTAVWFGSYNSFDGTRVLHSGRHTSIFDEDDYWMPTQTGTETPGHAAGGDIYVKSPSGNDYYFVCGNTSNRRDPNRYWDTPYGFYMPNNFVAFRKPNEPIRIYPYAVDPGGRSLENNYTYQYFVVQAYQVVPIKLVAYAPKMIPDWDIESAWQYRVNLRDSLEAPLMTAELDYYTLDMSETGLIPNVRGYARDGEPVFEAIPASQEQPEEHSTTYDYELVATPTAGTIVPYLPYINFDILVLNGRFQVKNVPMQFSQGELLWGLKYGYMTPSDYENGVIKKISGNYYSWIPSIGYNRLQSEVSINAYPHSEISTTTFTMLGPVEDSTYDYLPTESTLVTAPIPKDSWTAWTYYLGIGQGTPRKSTKVGSEITYSPYSYPEGVPYKGFIYEIANRQLNSYIRSQYPVETVISTDRAMYPDNNIVNDGTNI